MKKILPQITVGIICAILGFLLTYEIKYIISNSKDDSTIMSNEEALTKLNELKSENEKLLENNKTLQDQVKSYESSVIENETDDKAKKQIQLDKAALGFEKVSGSGIVITIEPKNPTFDNNLSKISEMDLSYIINNLRFVGAEAITINDIRVTPQTGIRTSGSLIRVGSTERINPEEEITISAIGDSTKLKAEMEFQGFLENLIGNNYNSTINVSDNITMDKSSDTLSKDFIKIEEKGE